jgi:hypothetical protein
MSRKNQVKRQLSAKPNSVKLTYVKPTSIKPTNVKPNNVKPLRTVPFENGFHFYTDIGKYTGITATSLSEFALKLQVIPTESVMFHFQRKDFQNWIKYTIKDTVLAQRIDNSKREQNAERLRKELVATIEARNNHAIPT